MYNQDIRKPSYNPPSVSETKSITVTLVNVDEPPYFEKANLAMTVLETATAGKPVHGDNATAVDVDAGQELLHGDIVATRVSSRPHVPQPDLGHRSRVVGDVEEVDPGHELLPDPVGLRVEHELEVGGGRPRCRASTWRRARPGPVG